MPKAADEPPEPAISPSVAGSTSPLVFVIDDDQSVVSTLRRELQRAGYRVRGFTNPVEGLLHISSARDIFALITDYRMPGIMGDRLLAEVQKEHPDLPCIVITAAATGDTVERLTKSSKVVRILPKPWDRTVLLSTLDSLR